ncbi:MAG: dihydroorotase [Candidatus Omnitrophica bacterium]|nr:dihydroorotase [Candidatus Omnitrophota bacterium]
MNKIIIKNGRLIDPAQKIDEETDILIEEGKIAELGKVSPNNAEVLDVKGKLVMPGFIDMHTHLRSPGREDEETFLSGGKAAVKGGYTAVCSMANTQPPADNQGVIEYIRNESGKAGLARVYPVGAVTKGLKGEEIAELGELKTAGAVAVSDDGHPVMNSDVMRRALEYARMFGLTVIDHCEDLNLSSGGMMNEGYLSTTMGLRGIPDETETIMVARDIELARLTGGKIHITHISSARSVELIRQAKKSGVSITCDVTPHHLVLTEDAVKGFNTNAKMNPPLRSEKDIEELKKGLVDGTIDAIATDHAPHSEFEKEVEFDYAPFGIIGLQTAMSVIMACLVEKRILTLTQLVEKMSLAPARILGLKGGNLSVGQEADITIVSPDEWWVVSKEVLESKCKNTPFLGQKLKGRVTDVLIGGKIILRKGEFFLPRPIVGEGQGEGGI